jgi:type IV secretory pathway TraG/TraD family ATPase VirD4
VPDLHGWTSVKVAFASASIGVVVGLIIGRAPLSRVLWSPLTAAAALIIGALVWQLLSWVLHIHLGDTLNEILGDVFVALVGTWFGRNSAHLGRPEPNHKRGTLLGSAITRISATKPHPRSGLTVAGLPVYPEDETKHFKMIGTTGTGKSTAIRELLAKALERGDRAVIADPDFGYVDRFYDPNRGDVILNPFDPRAARWDLFAEMTTIYDADQLARSLIVDTEGTERPWRNYARVFLISLLRQLHRVKHDDMGELYKLLSVTPIDDLRDLLSDTPAGPYLTQDNGKFFGAVRAVANTHLAALEPIALQSSRERISVRAWVRRGQATITPGVLFLPYRANELASLRSIISTWMRLAIFEAMSHGEGDQKLWFVVDELDALGAIDGLKDALARLRKFGGRCVLGFQSIAQVSGTYGHAEAQTIVENCANTLILRCSASEGGGTARFASKLIGEREVLRKQVTNSRGGGYIFASNHRSVSTSIHHVTESAVLPSEIEQLPDLQGYLKLASTPEWWNVRLNPLIDK